MGIGPANPKSASTGPPRADPGRPRRGSGRTAA